MWPWSSNNREVSAIDHHGLDSLSTVRYGSRKIIHDSVEWTNGTNYHSRIIYHRGSAASKITLHAKQEGDFVLLNFLDQSASGSMMFKRATL